jgi:hypothetical protein
MQSTFDELTNLKFDHRTPSYRMFVLTSELL